MGNTSGGTSFDVQDQKAKPATELPTASDAPPETSEYGPGMDNWFMRKVPEGNNNNSNNPLTGLPKMPLRSFSNQGPTQYTNDRENDNMGTVYYKPMSMASDSSDKENDQNVSHTEPVPPKSHKRNNSIDTDVTQLTTATPMSIIGKRKKNPAPPPPGNLSNVSFTSERKSSVGSLATLESSAETATGVRKKKRKAPPPPVPVAPPSVIVEEPPKRDSTGILIGEIQVDTDVPEPVIPAVIVMPPPPPPPQPPPPLPPTSVPTGHATEEMQIEEEETLSPLTAALRSAVNEREKRIKENERRVVVPPMIAVVPPPPAPPPPLPPDGVPVIMKDLPQPAEVFSDELKSRVHDRELRRERGDLKLPEQVVPFSKVFNMELQKAYLDRTQRREHGELKMRVAPPAEGTESEAGDVDLKNDETGEVATKTVTASTDWSPDQDLEGDNLDGPDVHAEITARGKTIPDAMYLFSRQPQRTSVGDKHKRMSKMKKSVKSALGSIGRGFSRSHKSKVPKSKVFEDVDWEIFPAQEYDEPPNDPIEIHRIEKHPAYAYNAKKGQLVLIPNHEDVIVTTDGKYIKESDLSKVQRRKKSHSRKYTKKKKVPTATLR